MGNFDQEAFNDFILDNGVIGFFENPITLKSGRLSNWYVNWRNVAEDVYLIDELSDHVIAFVRDAGLAPDCFFGVPEGATKLGLITQYKWAKSSPLYGKNSHVLPMGRGKPKDHGAAKDRYFLASPKGNVIVTEDVTTTGGSLLKTIDNLSEIDAKIIAALGLTNRMEVRDDNRSVEQAVKDKGYQYFAMSNGLQLLPEAYKRLKPGDHIGEAIEKEFHKYGVEPLRLR
jgi:orotate phosphoribosyltransferase